MKSSEQYPRPVGPYKICLKNAVNWRAEDHVRLQISVGKPVYEGEKLYALLEWSRHRFKTVTLVVSDTLQRWNLMFETGCDSEEAYARSREEGDQWLVRNASSIALVQQATVTRWDDLLHTSDFSAAREVFETLGRSDFAFQFALGQTKSAFWTRNFGKRGFSVERRPAFDAFSEQFLLEELAVFSTLCSRPGIDAYAGSWLEAIFGALRKNADPFFNGFRKDWLQVDFTRNRGYMPVFPAAQDGAKEVGHAV